MRARLSAPPLSSMRPLAILLGKKPGARQLTAMPRGAELDGEVLADGDGGGLAGRVAVGAVVAEGADAEAGDAGGDEHAAGVGQRRARLQQRREVAEWC